MRRRILTAASIAALSLLLIVQATTAAEAAEITVRGRIGRTVEAGGWLLVSPKQKYLLLNAARWRNESWFREGTEVEALGEVQTDVLTTQMEGVPFQARTLRPVSDSGNTARTPGAALVATTRAVVSGDSLVQARPDTAMISIAVVTQAQTALAAQQ